MSGYCWGERKVRGWNAAGLVAILIGVFWAYVPFAFAAGEAAQTLQVKVTHYAVSSQVLPAGDEEAHVIGMGKREGEAQFSNGETAKYSTVFTFDAYRGKPVPSRGYTKFEFNDGASFSLSWESKTVPDKDGLAATSGQGTIIKGVGRFNGIKGSAVYSGKELKPASEDPKRTTVTNATITYTLP
ncbi:MAG: hypothetical protein AB1473_21165 [Thermodesulfobacteriota bacterium]